MCGMSEARINGEDIDLEIGYPGGFIKYAGFNKDYNEDCIYANIDYKIMDKEIGRKNLSKFTKDELIDMIIQFIDNAEEV